MRQYGDWLAANYYYIAMPCGSGHTAEYVGQQVKALRIAKGWTRYRLAQVAGLRETHVSRIEDGAYNIRVDILKRLSDALGEKIDY